MAALPGLHGDELARLQVVGCLRGTAARSSQTRGLKDGLMQYRSRLDLYGS
jgi:hypothetical protein